ncbi:MAG TPA: alanine dehydrogenase [Cytophagales bacterium]|nr:alanine dehydrogenase [Cytophagales bacterium]
MAKTLTSTDIQALAESALLTQEQPLKIKQRKNSLFIGLPRETQIQENRISLTPESVSVLTSDGHKVWVEAGAGLPSKYSDRDYSEAGAKIVYSQEEVFKADIILKVAPPTLKEIELIQESKTLISALQVAQCSTEYLNAINKKKLTAIAFEFIEDKVGSKPVVRAMSEIAGSTVMLIGAEYLNSTNGGKGVIIGGITGVPPTKVVIIGAGTVAEYAARNAIGMGAEVMVLDNRLYKLRRIKQNLNHQIHTCTINAAQLKNILRDADLVIGALRSEDASGQCVVTEEMVQGMQPNSVIIDVSIDQGGCFETSELTTLSKPSFKKYDVIHYCVPNIASRVARTASNAFSNIFTPTIMAMSNYGGVEGMIFAKEWLMKGVYAYKGCITHQGLAKKFDMTHKDLKLLMFANLKYRKD